MPIPHQVHIELLEKLSYVRRTLNLYRWDIVKVYTFIHPSLRWTQSYWPFDPYTKFPVNYDKPIYEIEQEKMFPFRYRNCTDTTSRIRHIIFGDGRLWIIRV
jgi:hypothetical protein